MGEALDKAMQQLEKDFSAGVVFMGDSKPLKVDAIPTGSIALDNAIGIGGVPRGRITEAYGREQSGKSTLVYHVISEAQKMGLLGAIIDAEHALDRKYAEAIGVDFNKLILCQPDYGEQGLDVAEALVRSGEVGVLAIDSVAALVPRAELEGSHEDQQVGLQARMLGKALRKLAGVTAKSNTALILVNQLRLKVGVMYGNPETTPGGLALKYYASVRLDMRKSEDIKDGKECVGIIAKVKVVKDKVAPPLKEVFIPIYYGEGFCKASGLIDAGIEAGLIRKGGAWLTYGDIRWQGRDAARTALRSDIELMAKLDRDVRPVVTA